MEGLLVFTTTALLVTMVITIQNLIRYVRDGDWNGVLAIALAFAGGVVAATWAAHADVTANLVLITGGPPLGDLDGGSLALLGLGIGAAAPVLVDAIKARDNSDSAAKPKLIDS